MRIFLLLCCALLGNSKNLKAQLVFNQIVLDTDVSVAVGTAIADLNGDNRADVIGNPHAGNLKWYENKGQQQFITHETPFPMYGAQEDCVYPCDMDQDQDIDLVCAERESDRVVWLENNGQGQFERHVIDATMDAPWSVYAYDLDNDGDFDVQCAANFSSEIAWFENNGAQSFTKHTLIQSFEYATAVFAADIDSDNDGDIIGCAAFGSGVKGIIWWENVNNDFSTRHFVDPDFNSESLFVFDADGDLDQDILAAALGANRIVLWKNDGTQQFTQHTIAQAYNGSDSAIAADLDSDGDPDILAVGYTQSGLHYWENDGIGNFVIHEIGNDYQGAAKVQAADLDGDGDLDLGTANSLQNSISIWINGSSQVSAQAPAAGEPFEIYPNPATNIVTFKLPENEPKTIQVVNQAGRVVHIRQTSTNAIDLGFLPAGMYVFNISTAKHTYSQKLTIQK